MEDWVEIKLKGDRRLGFVRLLKWMGILENRVRVLFQQVTKDPFIVDDELENWELIIMDIEYYYILANRLFGLLKYFLVDEEFKNFQNEQANKDINNIRNYLIEHPYDGRPKKNPSPSWAYSSETGPILRSNKEYGGFFDHVSGVENLVKKYNLLYLPLTKPIK